MMLPLFSLLIACVDLPPEPEPDSAEPEDSGGVPFVPPSWVPAFQFHADAPEDGEGGILAVPVMQPGGGGVVVLDDTGAVIWAYPPDAPLQGQPPTRARFSLDGRDIIFSRTTLAYDLKSEIVSVPLDGGAPRTVGITSGHTDFTEYTPGGFAMLGWDIRNYGDRKIMGENIIERAADGTERVVWTVFDEFEPDLTRVFPSHYAPDRTVEGWSHINGISYSDVDDAYYVTMSFNQGVAKIDRASGQMDWYIGEPGAGTFTNPDGDRLLMMPHSVQRIDGGILVLSRGNAAIPGTCSEAVELELDHVSNEVRRGWSYETPDCLLVTFYGGAERLPGGNTVITWTSAGRIDQVTPDGKVTWGVSTDLGSTLGFSSWAPAMPSFR